MMDQKWYKEYQAAQSEMRAEQRRQFTNGMLVGASAIAAGLLLAYVTVQALKTPQPARPQTAQAVKASTGRCLYEHNNVRFEYQNCTIIRNDYARLN